MRLLVFGSRGWDYPFTLFAVLDQLHRENPADFMLITGGARGADAYAEQWAQVNTVTNDIYPADWGRLGKRAGLIRNQQMVDEGHPTHAVGFWDGKSRGTRHMIDEVLSKTKIPRRIITDDVLKPIVWTTS